jgi:hypothetical protein
LPKRRPRLLRLAGHFGEALRGAHHVRRVHRLVGRDQHKLLRARLLRGARHRERSADVVGHRLEGVVLLHQRHVLVRGCMEHNLRLVPGENLRHAARVLRIADHRNHRHARLAVAEFLLYGVEREFRRVE